MYILNYLFNYINGANYIHSIQQFKNNTMKHLFSILIRICKVMIILCVFTD